MPFELFLACVVAAVVLILVPGLAVAMMVFTALALAPFGALGLASLASRRLVCTEAREAYGRGGRASAYSEWLALREQ